MTKSTLEKVVISITGNSDTIFYYHYGGNWINGQTFSLMDALREMFRLMKQDIKGGGRGMSFREELRSAVNRHSKENGSNTPDFILAQFLERQLDVFDETVAAREELYGGNIGNQVVPPIGENVLHPLGRPTSRDGSEQRTSVEDNGSSAVCTGDVGASEA